MIASKRYLRILSFALALALAGLTALLSAGCAHPQVVEIISNPSGATVYVNGEEKGVTKTKVELQFGSDPVQRVAVQVRKARFKPILQYWRKLEVPEKWEVELEPE